MSKAMNNKDKEANTEINSDAFIIGASLAVTISSSALGSFRNHLKMTHGTLWKGAASILIDFSAWTSTHGVPHIGLANARWLRIFWIIVFVICCIMFIYQEALILIKYFSYPVNVDTALSFGERIYPAVTICNINAYKFTLAQKHPALGNLITAYQKETPDTDFGFDTTTYDKQLRATRWMNLMYSDLMEYDKTAGIAYTYDDLVITCTYNTESCNETEWKPYSDPYYGRCFTFNTDGDKKSSRAGPLYGLSLVLRVNQAEYLPWAQSAGITFLVHDPDDHPFVYTSGYYAAAGSASSVGIRYISKKKLSAPYSDCTDKGSKQKLYYETKRYQTEACVRSCLQDKFTATCGCYDPTYEYKNGSAEFESCYNTADRKDTSKNIICMEKITDSDGVNGFDINRDCDCPQSCTDCIYKMTLSTAYWPAIKYTPTECVNPVKNHIYWTPQNDKTACKEWYKSNTVYLEIYYERMNYQALTESEAYAFLALISDTGGQVGLWLGMSVISVIEIGTLFVLLLCYCLTRPKDAYLPEFDDDEEAKQREWQRKMQIKLEKENNRKLSAGSLDSIYNGKDVDLPPAISDAR